MSSAGDVRWISHPDQYRGEATVGIHVWGGGQGPEPTAGQRRQNFQLWKAFFAQRTPIRELSLGRVTDEVVRTLQPQTDLTALTIWYGRYTDLSPLIGMSTLNRLELGGATQLTDLHPLTQLGALADLEIENARRLRDYSALGNLTTLRRLVVQRSFTGPRTDADSLDFLSRLTQLEELRWDPRVATLDYSPLLGLKRAARIGVTAMKGMTPSMADLEWALPGMQAYAREIADQRWPAFSSDGEVQMMSYDLKGRLTVSDVDEEEAEELWEEHEPFDDPLELTGPVAGRTIRTITSTARTRIEDFWLRVESPVVPEDVDVPPSNVRVLDSFSFAGPAEGPLLIWDAPLPDGTTAGEYFGGNLDVWTPPEEIRLFTTHLSPLTEAEVELILPTVRTARGWRQIAASRDRLDAESDEFVLRFAQTVALQAVELAPVADQLIALGTIRSWEFSDSIGSLITAGEEAVRAAVADPQSVRRKDLHPSRDVVLRLAEAVMSRRRRTELMLVTPFDEVLAGRARERGDQLIDDLDDDDDDQAGLRSARAVVTVDGRLYERVVLVDTSGVAPEGVHDAVRAATAWFGGDIEAGPELAPRNLGGLYGSTHVWRIRRRSALPIDEYVARYASRP